VAEKLFQPFESSKPGGTGLGLSVARQTARLHGGDIRWQRADGLTWFLVELPNWHGWHSDR
jgi:two-component system sensor kinase FixL